MWGDHRFKSVIVSIGVVSIIYGTALAASGPLPQRKLDPPKTTSGVPHVQLGVKVVEAVSFGSLAISRDETHGFASQPRGWFALSWNPDH